MGCNKALQNSVTTFFFLCKWNHKNKIKLFITARSIQESWTNSDEHLVIVNAQCISQNNTFPGNISSTDCSSQVKVFSVNLHVSIALWSLTIPITSQKILHSIHYTMCIWSAQVMMHFLKTNQTTRIHSTPVVIQ